jgi:hypothetical protein
VKPSSISRRLLIFPSSVSPKFYAASGSEGKGCDDREPATTNPITTTSIHRDYYRDAA